MEAITRTTPTNTSNNTHSACLPSLKTILTHRAVYMDPRIAGQILASFAFLACYIAITPPLSFASEAEAFRDYIDLWQRLCCRLPSSTREYVLSIDLAESVSILAGQIEDVRQSGTYSDGNDLSARAGVLITVSGLEVLQKGRATTITEIFEHYNITHQELVSDRVSQVRARRIDISAITLPAVKETQGDCIICWLEMKKPVKLKACSHVFCKTCIEFWVNGCSQGATSHCPVCRSDIARDYSFQRNIS